MSFSATARDLGPGCCVPQPSRLVVIASTAAITVLVALSVWAQLGEVPPLRPNLVVVDVVVALLSCAAVPLVLRHPVPTAVGLAVLAAVSWSAVPTATLATVHTARMRPARTALLVALGDAAGHILRGWWRPMPGLSFAWWVLLVLAVHAALLAWGARARSQVALLMALRERAHRAERDADQRLHQARLAERRRIAMEMHDTLAHRLSLLAASAGAVEFRPDAAPEKLATAAGVIRSGATMALTELREVIGLLRDDEDERMDRERPQPGWSDVDRLVTEARAAGASIEVQRDVVAEPPALTGRTGYRLVQEALTNARRHAPGQPVRLAVAGRPGGRLTITVSNPLPTADSGPVRPGNGLIGMEERLHQVGGELLAEVATGQFRLHAWLPWPGR
jgi:signal transduction histidine kinase